MPAPSDPSHRDFSRSSNDEPEDLSPEPSESITLRKNLSIEELSSEPPPIATRADAKHMGRVVDPDVAEEDDVLDEENVAEETEPPIRPVQLAPKHMGRVVDPDVADEDDPPIEQLTSEPPPIVQRPKGRRRVPDEPSLRPHTVEPMPSTEDLLDPGKAPPPIPRHEPRRATPSVLSPRMTAVFGALFGLAGIVAIFAILNRVSPQSPLGTSVTPTETASATPHPSASAASSAVPDFEEEGPAIPGPWRVAALEKDPNIKLLTGKVGLEPFVKTLQKRGLSKHETYRILSALKKFDAMERPRKSDEFIVAIDRSKGTVRGFELKVSELEVYQAKEDNDGLLVGSKLDMKIATRLRSSVVRITGGALEADLKRGSLRESVANVVDQAFDGRASVASMPKNSTLRVVVQEKTALGRFAEYDHVVALEYVSSKTNNEALRLYRFKDGSRYGYFDQKGREPYRGGWRKPCPGAPVTSPFNPKRLHPILKTIRPHNGTDFGAATGTPIHATSYGTIDWIGPRGPAGNLIIIKHPGNIESYYMHMHRFASGLKKGDKVETFQVIGVVGNTGRSTGAHLHFGIRKNGTWINPLSLQLDGDRLVTASYRNDFDKVKEQLDKQLDAIALPPPVEDTASEPPDDPDQPDQPDDPSQPDQPNQPDEPRPDPAAPRETFDDEALEPAGSVNDEPPDDPI